MKFLFSYILFIVCNCAFGQYVINGTLRDQSDMPVQYAEIFLSDLDKNIRVSGFSDEDGKFVLKSDNGIYVLKVYYLNQILYTREITLDRNLDLSVITIESSNKLEELVIDTKRKLIERQVDRLVYNVENSITAKGTNLVQTLSNTPMLSVNDFGISIVGKSSVGVMINGRILNIGGADLINYLKSLRSDDIAKIEIITTPPAKYEAEGNSGLINIILKKNPSLGFNGNASTSYTQATYPGTANNASLNYRTDRLSTSLKLRQYDSNMKSTEQIDVIGNTSIYNKDTRKDMSAGEGVNVALNYILSEKSNAGLNYDLGNNRNNMDIESTSEYYTLSSLDSVLTTNSRHRNKTVTHTLSAYFETKLDTVGKNLSLTANYFSNDPDTDVNFATTSQQTAVVTPVRNISYIQYQIWSGQADLTLPYKAVNIETGGKFTNFSNDSDVRYLTFNSNNYEIDPFRSDKFNYDEQNAAVYLSMSRNFGAKWSAKGGVRYEHSFIKGYSITTREENKYNYGNWFPTAYVTYRKNENHFFSASYSRRINRPNFRALNPFRWYSNPFSFYTGNPQLRPSFNHNIEVSYLYKNIFSAMLYGQKTENGFGRTIDIIDAVKEVNYKNYLTEYNYGINLNMYLNPVKWIDSYLNMSSFYSESKSTLPEISPQKGFSFYYSLNNTLTIHKAKGIYLLANFWHSLPAKQGNTYSKSLYGLSSGVRFNMLKNRLYVAAFGEDLLKGLVSRGTIYFSEYSQKYRNYYDNRRFTLSLTYSFGNSDLRNNNRDVDFSEKQRAN